MEKMPKTLSDLAKDMETLSANLTKEVSRCSVETALTIHNELTAVTPVDTSTALSNWDVSVGTLQAEFHEPWIMGKRGSTKLASKRFSDNEANVVLQDKLPGQTIFISNSADYIKKLNDGSSSQEPAGFVERSILLGKLNIKNFKLKLR